MPTKIEWAEETWNPITGCSPISEGCAHCYAKRMAQRLLGRYGYPADDPFRPGTVHPDKMDNPPKWRGGKMIFVCSMGDLFHEDVPNYKTYGRIFDAARMSGYGKFMVKRQPDIFMFLTKRPQKMLEVVEFYRQRYGGNMPDNCWLGVTVENDKERHRIDTLRSIPAAVRFVSFEPLLSEIGNVRLQGIHWAIVGGETGPGARPMNPYKVLSLRDQCQAAGVPFFFKSWGDYIHESQLYEMDDLARELDAASIQPDDARGFFHVGKKRAGRLLDGREWNEYPKKGDRAS